MQIIVYKAQLFYFGNDLKINFRNIKYFEILCNILVFSLRVYIEKQYICTFPNFTYKVGVVQNLPAIGSVCSAKTFMF